MALILAWAGDWLVNEITAGRVISSVPLPALSIAAACVATLTGTCPVDTGSVFT